MGRWKDKIDHEKRSYMKLMGILQTYPDAYTRLNCLKTKFENFIASLEATTIVDQPSASQFPTVVNNVDTNKLIKAEIKQEVESQDELQKTILTNIKIKNNTISQPPSVGNNSYAETDVIVID